MLCSYAPLGLGAVLGLGGQAGGIWARPVGAVDSGPPDGAAECGWRSLLGDDLVSDRVSETLLGCSGATCRVADRDGGGERDTDGVHSLSLSTSSAAPIAVSLGSATTGTTLAMGASAPPARCSSASLSSRPSWSHTPSWSSITSRSSPGSDPALSSASSSIGTGRLCPRAPKIALYRCSKSTSSSFSTVGAGAGACASCSAACDSGVTVASSLSASASATASASASGSMSASALSAGAAATSAAAAAAAAASLADCTLAVSVAAKLTSSAPPSFSAPLFSSAPPSCSSPPSSSPPSSSLVSRVASPCCTSAWSATSPSLAAISASAAAASASAAANKNAAFAFGAAFSAAAVCTSASDGSGSESLEIGVFGSYSSPKKGHPPLNSSRAAHGVGATGGLAAGLASSGGLLATAPSPSAAPGRAFPQLLHSVRMFLFISPHAEHSQLAPAPSVVPGCRLGLLGVSLSA